MEVAFQFRFFCDRKDMEKQFTDLLSKFHSSIRQYVDLGTLIPHMNAAGLVSSEDISFLNNSLYPISSRVDYLIFCLPRKGKDTEYRMSPKRCRTLRTLYLE